MNSLIDLHRVLVKTITDNPDFKESLLDFYLKSQLDEYINSIQKSEGRKLFISGSTTHEIKNQLVKLLLISDTIVFTTSDFDKKPTLDVFPFPDGFNSDLVQVMSATEQESGKSFIPSAAEALSIIGMALSDDKLQPVHDSIIGFDFDNPKNSYKRNKFTLSSTRITDKNKKERPALVGITERYNSGIYDLIFREADYLFNNGNIVFSPYIRTSLKTENTLHNAIKANSLNTNYTVFNSEFTSESLHVDILNNLKIPYIENVSLELLSAIIKDEGEALHSFRRQFTRSLEDIKELKDEDEIKKELKYLKRNLFEDELDKVELLCKKVSKMKTLSAVGAVVTTAVIGISAYLGLDISSIIMAAGGTGLTTINELYKLHIDKKEIQKNPMYFLWKLKSKA